MIDEKIKLMMICAELIFNLRKIRKKDYKVFDIYYLWARLRAPNRFANSNLIIEKMTEKEKLKELAIEVNEFLSGYIKIHDVIHREAESFLSVIKNIFGQGVPMSKLLDYAKSLIPLSESLKARLVYFKLNSYSKLSNDEKYYFDMLFNFYTSLERTVNCLIQKQILMDIKSNDPLNKISLKEFKIKDNEYKSLINEYLAIGDQLNNSSQIIFR